MIWSLSWIIIVAYLYFLPGKDLPELGFWELFQVDKAAHLITFMLLVLFLKIGLKRQSAFPLVNQRSSLIALCFAIPYGGILEMLQGALSIDRTSDVYDFVANTAGSILGIVIFRLIYGRNR